MISKIPKEVIEIYQKLKNAGFEVSREAEELADILEVVEAIGITKGLSMTELNRIKKDKYNKRGSFSKRTVLIRID